PCRVPPDRSLRRAIGIHLNFELHLPGSVSRPEIVDTLGQLRAHAMRTPVGARTILPLVDIDPRPSVSRPPGGRYDRRRMLGRRLRGGAGTAVRARSDRVPQTSRPDRNAGGVVL